MLNLIFAWQEDTRITDHNYFYVVLLILGGTDCSILLLLFVVVFFIIFLCFFYCFNICNLPRQVLGFLFSMEMIITDSVSIALYLIVTRNNKTCT